MCGLRGGDPEHAGEHQAVPGLAKMNGGIASWAGQVDYYDKLDKAEKALNEIIRQNQRAQEPLPSQSTPDGGSGDSPLSRLAATALPK